MDEILETDFVFNEELPLDEYPRPQLKRDSFINLNGKWEFKTFTDDNYFDNFNEEIIVPYPMESKLSGINRRLEDKERIAYRKVFKLDKSIMKDIIFLHFGAVDQICDVYLNRTKVSHHEGGYLPFKIDITKYLKDENELVVIVKDELDTTYPTGKQKKNNGGIWYTPVSGIWQTVWLESVDKNYLDKVIYKPDIDNKIINMEFICNENNLNKKIKIFFDNKLLNEINTNEDKISLTLDELYLWSPESANMYDVTIEIDKDKVESYFAMRKFSYLEKNGKVVMALNNKPYFFHGLLDQGWYPDGLYTVRNYDVYRFELEKIKELGFNTLRKHIKIEPLIWYHLCDKLGIVVWQDMVNVGEYSFIKDSVMPILGKRDSKLFGSSVESQAEMHFTEYMKDTIDLLYNVPSIALWTIFNEGWGEFDPKGQMEIAKSLDDTRFFDSASGWFYKKDENDLESHHIYFQKIDFNKKPLKQALKTKKPIVISECGGFLYKVEGHNFTEKRDFGYRRFKTLDEYNASFLKLYEEEIIKGIEYGLSASIYTQVSDVEEELNGLMTYDRKVVKLNKDIALKVKNEINNKMESL